MTSAAHPGGDRRVHAGVPGVAGGAALGKFEVIETLADVMLVRGIPEHIRWDNGPEFIAEELRKWMGRVGHEDVVYRAGESVGERLQREFQWKAER